MKNINFKETTIAILILLAAFSRILPHPFNFTPITAMALFGSAYFSKKYMAFLVPLAAMVISDAWLEFISGFGFHSGTWLIYGTFALITLLGIFTLRKINLISVIGSSILGSVIFYLITNFAYFYSEKMYPHSWQGVLASYSAALPFFQNTLAGDLMYSGILFGSFYLLQKYVKVLKTA